jgi:hypothetical protein
MARNRPPLEGTSGVVAGAGVGVAKGSLVEAGLLPGRVLCAVESGMGVKIGYRCGVATTDVPYAFLQTSFRH